MLHGAAPNLMQNNNSITFKPKTFVFWSLAGMMALALILSVTLFSRQSLRLDESQSLWQTSHSTGKLITIIAGDVHVPLYHLLLHFWQFFFGNGVYPDRILSLIFFLFSIPALYFLGKEAYDWKSGLFAALLFTISPFMNWYGNEIRMYSLLTFLAIVNQYFFIRLFKDRKAAIWLAYAVSALLGLYTHYFFSFVLVAQLLFYFLNRNLFGERSFKKFATIAGILAVLFLPWIIFVFHLGNIAKETPLLQAPSTVDFFNTFSQFIFGFQNDHLNTVLVSLWPLSILFGFLALRSTKREVSPSTIYLMVALMLPILLAFAVSFTIAPIFLSRYMIFTLPSLYLIASWVLRTYPQPLSRALRALVVIAMLTSLSIEAWSATTPVKEDYLSASSYIEAHATASDLIVVSAPFTIYPLEYYYKGSSLISTLPIWDQNSSDGIPAFDEKNLPNDVDKLKDAHQNLYLLLSYDQGYEDKIKSYFDSHFQMVDQRSFSKDLNLYVYKLRYDIKE
jgi:mannosyltransferase